MARELISTGALCLALAAVGCGGSSDGGTGGASGAGGSGPTELVAPLQTTFDTTGGSVHVECEGSTTDVPIVFLAGGADPASTWDELIAELGDDVLTCAFTRPGVIPSYVASELYTPQLFADALAEVLPQLGIGDRFIMVGHSLGGMTLRVFGSTHANRLTGALFLDPTIPSSDPVLVDELMDFQIDAAAAEAQTRAVSGWSEDVPLTVLSHDPELALESGLWTEAQQNEWAREQEAYGELTPSGTQYPVPGSEHYIYRTNLTVVVDELRSLMGD